MSVVAAALPLAREYDAAAPSDRSINLGAAAAYLIAAVFERQADLLDLSRSHYQAALARVDATPNSPEAQCARVNAVAGLEALDAQQLRTRWIPQRGCNDRNRNADECVLARYTADPAAPPRQSEIDLAHRVAMHYKGLFTFNAQLAARAFTIAAQFETRAGRLKDAHFDTLSALAVLHVAPNILDIANSSAGLSMSPPTQTNPGLESPGPAPAAGLGPAI